MAALVEGDHPQAGAGQPGRDPVPDAGVGGEPVQQHHRLPAPAPVAGVQASRRRARRGRSGMLALVCIGRSSYGTPRGGRLGIPQEESSSCRLSSLRSTSSTLRPGPGWPRAGTASRCGTRGSRRPGRSGTGTWGSGRRGRPRPPRGPGGRGRPSGPSRPCRGRRSRAGRPARPGAPWRRPAGRRSGGSAARGWPRPAPAPRGAGRRPAGRPACGPCRSGAGRGRRPSIRTGRPLCVPDQEHDGGRHAQSVAARPVPGNRNGPPAPSSVR